MLLWSSLALQHLYHCEFRNVDVTCVQAGKLLFFRIHNVMAGLQSDILHCFVTVATGILQCVQATYKIEVFLLRSGPAMTLLGEFVFGRLVPRLEYIEHFHSIHLFQLYALKSKTIHK